MNEEMERILKMVEEGKISSEEASQLLETLHEPEKVQNKETKQSYMGRSVKIRIHTEEKERVRLNIPIKFVKWMLKTGHGIAQSIPDAQPYMEDIDLNDILRAIDNHETGKIIDLATEDGEKVAIYIE